MDVQEVGMEVAQDRWRALENVVVNHPVPLKNGKYLDQLRNYYLLENNASSLSQKVSNSSIVEKQLCALLSYSTQFVNTFSHF